MTATTTAVETNEWKHLFGVCGYLAEDFGFNPLLLRVGFGVSLIFAPLATAAAYAALGVVVLSSRLIFPNRKPKPVTPQIIEEDYVPLPLAA